MLRKVLSRASKPELAPTITPVPVVPWGGQPIADAFVAAIRSRNWDAARAAYAEMPGWSERANCINELELDDASFEGLTEWINQTGWQDPFPLLVRGSVGVRWAWAARGSGWSNTVSEEGWRLFFERLRTADQDLHRAARLDPENPNPWVELLPVAKGLQIPKAECDLRFEQAFQRDPSHLGAHLHYLQCIAGKWSGDDNRMWRFARDVHEAVPAGSPLRVVVASAYDELVATNAQSEGAQPHDIHAAAQVVYAAVRKSVLHPDFANHGWEDQRKALSCFLRTLVDMETNESYELGTQLIPLLRNSPHPSLLEGLGGETDGHKWANLRKYYGYDKAAVA